MPKCQYCGHSIRRLEADICPSCGHTNPIAKDYKTMDVTASIAKLGENVVLYRSRSRKTYVLLCMLLGFAGAHNFYILKKKLGLIDILVSLIIIGALGSMLCFLTPVSYFGYLIGFGAAFFAFFLYSFRLRVVDSPRDGNGEFLR